MSKEMQQRILGQEEIKTVKCKPGQGKLNRLIAKAQLQLGELGFPDRRFKRNYEAGTATYKCPNTGKTAFVNIATKEISGTCFDNFLNSQQDR